MTFQVSTAVLQPSSSVGFVKTTTRKTCLGRTTIAPGSVSSLKRGSGCDSEIFSSDCRWLFAKLVTSFQFHQSKEHGFPLQSFHWQYCWVPKNGQDGIFLKIRTTPGWKIEFRHKGAPSPVSSAACKVPNCLRRQPDISVFLDRDKDRQRLCERERGEERGGPAVHCFSIISFESSGGTEYFKIFCTS